MLFDGHLETLTHDVLAGADERLAAKVNFLGPVPAHRPELGSCWQWIGGVNSKGYASILVGGRRLQAHRYSYERAAGPIPHGLHADHLCRNRACMNPCHLEPVTPLENWLRGDGPCRKFKDQTHCKRGHPLSGDNLFIIKSTGSRACKECRRMHALAAYRNKTEEQKEHSRRLSRERDARIKEARKHGDI